MLTSHYSVLFQLSLILLTSVAKIHKESMAQVVNVLRACAECFLVLSFVNLSVFFLVLPQKYLMSQFLLPNLLLFGAHHLGCATNPHSCHAVFIDWFIFGSNFPWMRLLWERHDQSLETNLTPLRHWAGTAFLSQKKRCSKNRPVCKNGLTWAQYGSCMLLLIGPCCCIISCLFAGLFFNVASHHGLDKVTTFARSVRLSN